MTTLQKEERANRKQKAFEDAMSKPFGFIVYRPSGDGEMITGMYFNSTDAERQEAIRRCEFSSKFITHTNYSFSQFILTKKNYKTVTTMGTYVDPIELENFIENNK